MWRLDPGLGNPLEKVANPLSVLPEKSYRQRNMAGYSSKDGKSQEFDLTKHTYTCQKWGQIQNRYLS